MTKEQLQAVIEAKVGFVSIIKDEEASDNVAGDIVRKRYFYVNHTNADGTAGKTYVYYLLNTNTNEAWFYNTAPEALDIKEPTTDTVKINALNEYLKSNFNAYFVNRVDVVNNWAEADVFTLVSGSLQKKAVIVYKPTVGNINHLEVTGA